MVVLENLGHVYTGSPHHVVAVDSGHYVSKVTLEPILQLGAKQAEVCRWWCGINRQGTDWLTRFLVSKGESDSRRKLSNHNTSWFGWKPGSDVTVIFAVDKLVSGG